MRELISAVKWGDLDRVARFLEDGADPNTWQFFGWPLLLRIAAESRHAPVDMLALLLKSGADPNAVGEFGSAPLDCAAKAGNLGKVELLLDKGADIALVTHKGYDVMINAVYSRAPKLDEILRVLIARGAPLDAVSDYGESALSTPSREGRFEIVRLLLEAGADPAPLKWNELMRSIALGDLEDVGRDLGPEAVFSARDAWYRTPFHLSVMTGEVEKASLLLKHGAWPNAKGRCGKTNIMHAVMQNHAEMVRWLLDQGADFAATDEYEITALMVAAEYGATDCVRVLLEAGAEPCAVDHIKDGAINHAGAADIVRLLVDAGADVNRIGGEGNTLLMVAGEDGDADMVDALLEMGADPNVPCTRGTALQGAVSMDEIEIVGKLLAAGADPDAQDVDGETPLFFARSAAAARLLLAAGANASHRSDFGRNPGEWVRNLEIRDEEPR